MPVIGINRWASQGALNRPLVPSASAPPGALNPWSLALAPRGTLGNGRLLAAVLARHPSRQLAPASGVHRRGNPGGSTGLVLGLLS